MKSLVALTYFFMFAMTPGLMDQALETETQETCATSNKIYTGCEFTEPHDVDDWHACGSLCYLYAGCVKWSFHANEKCVMHDCKEATEEVEEDGTCGPKGCR